jgi:HPt (histidine-containing phosphotransfer) domain-containing protein
MVFFPIEGFTMHYDPTEALARIDNDTGLLAMLISVFLKERPNYIERLQTACAQQNLNALGDAAHNVKGASAAIGFDVGSQLAEELEVACRQSGVKTIASFENSTAHLVDVLNNCAEPLNKWVSENQ